MENLLPSFGNRLEESQNRMRRNQQWDPSRSTYAPGSMLPARLRCLTKMTEQETAIENPPEVKESSVEPVTQVISSQGVAEYIDPLPSVIGANGRGEAPQTRISRVLPDGRRSKSSLLEGGPKTIIGIEKDAPLLTFVNDAAADFFDTEEERQMAADYMTGSTQEYGNDPVDIFLKGEKGLAPMVHRTLAPGTHMVRTIAGAPLPGSAVADTGGGNNEAGGGSSYSAASNNTSVAGSASGLRAERGVMVLVTTRARLGPAATDSASQALSEPGNDLASRGSRRSRHDRSVERVKERYDFKVERPLGLELE